MVARPENCRVVRGIEYSFQVRDASILRGKDTRPITEAELRPRRADDPETFIPLDAEEVLYAFLYRGDGENVARMLSFQTICTPAFLNKVSPEGGRTNEMWRVSFLLAALDGLGSGAVRLHLLRLLIQAGCTAWNVGYQLAGEYGLSAFSALCEPSIMLGTGVSEAEHRELVALALQAGADPDARSLAVGALSPRARAARFPYPLFPDA